MVSTNPFGTFTINNVPIAQCTEAARAELCSKGWDHSYTCTCGICCAAWALMGPDGHEKGNYGPFEEQVIKDFCKDNGLPFIEGDE